MLRSTLLATACLLALSPGFAAANELKEGFYLGGFGGINWAKDADTSLNALTTEVDFDNGYGVGGALGYAWANGLRAEFETSYRNNSVDTLTGAGAGAEQRGGLSNIAFMANALMNIETDSVFTPYVGGGVGMSRVKAENIGTVSGDLLESRENKFAYQAIAGVAANIVENLDFTVDYRYFATSKPEFDTVGGAESELGNRHHSVMLGLRYTFADEMPAPVAPVAAPVPAAPQPKAAPVAAPAPAAAPRSFMVFFDWDQASLTAQAQDIVRSVAQYVQQGGAARIEVVGHADRSGKTAYNLALSEKRANAVQDALLALGVAPNDIGARGMGESDQLVATEDGVREAQNRRASIEIKQ